MSPSDCVLVPMKTNTMYPQKHAIWIGKFLKVKIYERYRSGFKEGGGERFFPLQEFEPLPTQRAPLCTTLRHPFLVTDPKNFFKALLAPIYTNFKGRGGGRRKNAIFWSKFSKKCIKTPFWPVFSKNCLRRREFCQIRVFIVI